VVEINDTILYMLIANHLAHAYNSEQRFDFPDINCNSGQTLLILGSSGVGKTTLLHILAGILKPKSGEVHIDNTNLYKLGTRSLDQYRGQHIGLIFQKPHFVQSISARDNLILAQNMANRRSELSKIDHLLSTLNIGHKADAKTHRMSQGEQQRLSIARAMVNDPKLILADEPTSALDDKNCNEVVHLMRTHADAAKAALVIVTHDQRLKDLFPDHIELS